MKVDERLVEADRAVGLAALEALPTVAVPDLARLTGVPVSELRRVLRTARGATGHGAPRAGASSDHPETRPPLAEDAASFDAGEPSVVTRDLGAALSSTAAG